MKKIFLVGAVLGTMAAANSASAHGFFSLSIGLPPVSIHVGSAPPVYVQPAPVYVQPGPVYVRPAPVMVAPPRVVVRAAPVVVVPACSPQVVYVRPGRHHRHHHLLPPPPPFCR